MKINSVTLKNFAGYEQLSLNLNPNTTYLIGKNGSGKSTAGINAIIACLQGVAQQGKDGNKPLISERFRVINPKARAANIIVQLAEDNGNTIDVMRNITASGQTLEFKGAIPGIELNQKWLNSLFNEFLIAPKRFLELSSKEQAIKLGIDTSVFDAEVKKLKAAYTEINAVVRSYGDIAPVPEVQPTDITALQSRKQNIQHDRSEQRKSVATTLNNKYIENKKVNDEARNKWANDKVAIWNDCNTHNKQVDALQAQYNECAPAVQILQKNGLNDDLLDKWLGVMQESIPPKKFAEELYPTEPTYIPEIPDDKELQDFDSETQTIISAIDAEIQDANTNNQNALLYTQYLDKVAKKTAKVNELAENERLQKEQQDKRLDYIKAFDLPFGNLTIDDDGNLLKEGRPIKEPHFSTGELLKMIPVLISTTCPELKYVFLQDFNLMDEEKQKEIIDYLTGLGYQLVVEYVGKEAIAEKNCIILKECKVVENYDAVERKPELA